MAEVEAEDRLSFSAFMLGYTEAFPDTKLLGPRNDALVARLLDAGDDATGPAVPEQGGDADSPAKRRFDAMVLEFAAWADDPGVVDRAASTNPVSYTHLTLPTIYAV